MIVMDIHFTIIDFLHKHIYVYTYIYFAFLLNVKFSYYENTIHNSQSSMSLWPFLILHFYFN